MILFWLLLRSGSELVSEISKVKIGGFKCCSTKSFLWMSVCLWLLCINFLQCLSIVNPYINEHRVKTFNWIKTLATRLLNKISSHSFPPGCALLPHFPPIYCNYFAQSLLIVKLFRVPEWLTLYVRTDTV